MKNRIISLILVLVLVFTLLPVYAIADVNAETEPKVDEGTQPEQSTDIQALVGQIKALLNGGQDSEQLKAQLEKLLKDLDSKDMSALFRALIQQLPEDQLDKLLGALDDPTIQKIFGMLESDEAKALVETIKNLIAGKGDVKDLLSGLSLDQVKALLELFIDEDELDRLFNSIPQEELEQLLDDFLNGKGKLEDIFKLIPEDALKALLESLKGKNNILDKLLENINPETLLEALKGLIGGDGNIDIEDLLKYLDKDALIEALKDLLAKNEDIGKILEKLDIEQLKGIIDGLLNGNFDDLKNLLPKLDIDTLMKMLESLFGDNETLKKLLENLDIEQLKEIIKGLLDKNGDIEDILKNLDKDELLEIIKGLVGDNDTIASILEKLDSEKLAEIIKALIDGGIDIGEITKGLDPYTLLKVISGLIGSELDVTGPKDVTVDEGKDAVFSVKVNTAGTYKYLWLEPNTIKSIDLGGIDLSGSKLELAMKLMAALKKAALSTTDTLTIAKTTVDDSGRTFACMIYNINGLKDITLFVTDEAKLTVNNHEHTKVVDTPAVAATCNKDGCTEGSHCSECGEIISKSEVIPATGHNYVYKVCANCGDEIPFPFVDVAKTSWYYGNIKYVWQHDIMKGVSDTKFAPESSMTRAMFVTVLYRLEGSPSVEGLATPPFTDIGASNYSWAYNAIVWAYNTGVTKGTSATTFAPGAAITRQEIVTMLYRYAGSPAVSGSLIFGDSSVISSWARSAVQWANSIGIITGYPNGNFGPVDATTRGQMAAIVHRYIQLTSVL